MGEVASALDALAADDLHGRGQPAAQPDRESATSLTPATGSTP